MKPIRLEIEGLHSFRERQVIDFAAVAESGLFGIFGPTGSGKSTILDAMTIALYGRAERNGRLGHTVNQSVGAASIAFEFSVSGAQGDEVYRVERGYRRGADGGLQRHSARLLRLAPDRPVDVLADRVDTVHQTVGTLLGLTFDDFTRAVVLPQGKFAEFLSLTGVDRRLMLERLFALERFGRGFTDQLQSRQREAENSLATLEAERSALEGSSDDALLALRAECAAAEEQVLEAERGLTVAARQLEIGRQVRDLQAALDDTGRRLQACETEDAVRVQPLRQAVDRAERSARVQPLLVRTKSAQETLTSARQAEQDALRQTVGLRVLVDEATQREAAARLEVDTHGPTLLSQRAALAQGRELERVVGGLQVDVAGLTERRDQLAREQATLQGRAQSEFRRRDELERQRTAQRAEMAQAGVSTAERAAVDQVRGVLQPLRYALEAQRKAQQNLALREKDSGSAAAALALATREGDDAERELAALEQAIADCTQPPVDERDLQDHRVIVASLSDSAQRLRDMGGAIDRGRREIAVQDRRTNVAHERVIALTEQRDAALVALQAARARWMALLQEDRRAAARRLAQELVAGDPCPVCGSREHPVRAGTAASQGQDALPLHDASPLQDTLQHRDVASGREASLAAALPAVDPSHAEDETRRFEAALAAAEAAVREAEREWTDTRAQGAAMAERLAAQERDREQEFGAIEQRTGMQFVTEQTLSAWLEELRGAVDAALVRLASWRTERERLMERRQAHNHTVQLRRDAKARAEVQLEAAQNEQQATATALQTAGADVMRASTAAGAVLSSVGVACDDDLLLSGETWLARLNESIRARDAVYAKAVAEAEQTEAELAQITRQAAESERALVEVAVRMAQVDAELSAMARDLDQREEQLRALTGGLGIDGALADVDEILARLRTSAQEAADTLRSTLAEADQAERRRVTAELEWRAAGAAADRLHAEVEAVLAVEGFATAAEASDATMDADEIAAAAQEIESFAETRRRLIFECERLERDLDGRSVAPDEWAALETAERTAQDLWRLALERRGGAQTSLESAEAKNGRWRELTERARTLSEEAGLLQELASLFRGNAFVDFLAQEQLTAVTRMATDHLSRVTGGRYALELSERGEFTMRDDFSGGERRPVSTLSGGETFMASLAMALALSGQIQLHGRYPLEFFFLDEGFGTLDPERLDTVISTLERLQKGSMLVGVITHVPELRQRIERRVMVEAATPLRGTRVKLDMG